MKCKCGGIMQKRLLAIDTEAFVCILCGRDNMPRRQPAIKDADIIDPKTSKSKRVIGLWKLPRNCPGCGRGNLTFTGRCQRCRYRAQRGLDLITGLPLLEAA